MKTRSRFDKLAKMAAVITGRPLTFLLAVAIIVIWAVTGPIFQFSDTWQLVINTGTTIVTFLMVFLIQNTQNRDTVAMQIKLDEIIRAMKGAHTAVLDLEELSDEELDLIMKHYRHLAAKARMELRRGNSDIGSPEVESLKELQEAVEPEEIEAIEAGERADAAHSG